jgi:hypothetical protein
MVWPFFIAITSLINIQNAKVKILNPPCSSPDPHPSGLISARFLVIMVNTTLKRRTILLQIIYPITINTQKL